MATFKKQKQKEQKNRIAAHFCMHPGARTKAVNMGNRGVFFVGGLKEKRYLKLLLFPIKNHVLYIIAVGGDRYILGKTTMQSRSQDDAPQFRLLPLAVRLAPLLQHLTCKGA